jgi:D-glycero-alpha-D-manno-heptose-7-phosphate kinase
MIISRTPFRVSFLGGGSDLPAFYERSPGAVLSTTIDKHMYIALHPFFEPGQTLIKYSRTELCTRGEEVSHPIVRECMRRCAVQSGIEITSTADVPAGTGLGSSSTFTVGLLNALWAYRGRFVPKDELARQACEVEIGALRSPIGKQDQYAAAHGGMNLIEFHPSGRVTVAPCVLPEPTLLGLERRLLLFYTGTSHDATVILADQQRELKSAEKFRTQQEMVKLVYEGRDALNGGDLDRFGELLHENWLLKRCLAQGITNPHVDALYARARAAGAKGGKLLGAGGGGFLLFYCREEQHAAVRQALAELRAADFRFDAGGTQVIYSSGAGERHEPVHAVR